MRLVKALRRYSLLFLLAAMWLVWIMVAASAQAARPYGVDDMLKTEAIGKVRFDPDGRYLVFERYGPFEAQEDFGRPMVIGQMRSKLYLYDFAGDGRATLLFPQRQGNSWTLNTISPDGRYVSFLRGSTDGLTPGVVDMEGSVPREFGVSVDRGFLVDPLWISDRELAFPAMPPGERPLFFSLRAELLDRQVEQWRRMRAGDEATASPIGSGRYSAADSIEGSLVLVDAAGGGHHTLGPGNFPLWFPSPDGRLLVALRDRKLVLSADQRVEHGANMGGVQKSLVLFDVEGSRPSVDLCRGCDVLQSSVNWSPDGSRLAFFARDEGRSWDDGSFRIYDRSSRTVRVARAPGLRPELKRSGFDMDVGAVWLGDTLVIQARPDSAPPETPAQWYRLGEEQAPASLTEAFGTEPTDVVAISRSRLIVLAGGDAWSVGADGARTNLTAATDTPVRLWQHPSPYGRVPQHDLRPSGTVLLETRAAGPEALQRLLFLDLSTGTIAEIAAPSPDAEFLAASADTRRAAVLDTSGGVGTLLVLGADGARHTVVELNRHLADVVGGTPVRIDHQGPDGGDRISWLLLPPGWSGGDPLPTVVSVYPGAGSPPTWTRWDLQTANALNDHVLAAGGYAVLYPAIPVEYQRVPRDTYEGLLESVSAAIEAAAAQGYVDPDRLIVQGQSYGGYATAALIGMTNRFKAAVAQSGIYDLVSLYGQFDPRLRLSVERDGLNLFTVGLLESSQGGMGGPPWSDPDHYLRNSPLMQVERVETPIMLIHGDLDYVPIAQAEEYFTALTRLNKDALFVRYFGEDHIFNSPANIRDMWARLFRWYEEHVGPPFDSAGALDRISDRP